VEPKILLISIVSEDNGVDPVMYHVMRMKVRGFSSVEVINDWWKIRNPEHRAGGLVALNNPPFVTLPISRSIGIFLSEFFLDDCTQFFAL